MFSPVVKSVKMKKPPLLAVFQEIRFVSFSCRSYALYVNLPLFHRRWAGIAKVKIKVKACEVHVVQ
jgi:hypothetical protein